MVLRSRVLFGEVSDSNGIRIIHNDWTTVSALGRHSVATVENMQK